MRNYIRRNKYQLFFAGLLLGMMLVYSFPYVLQQGPKGFHLWRQTDGLSFARHYYDNGLDFGDPQIFHLLFKDHSSARTVGEFPGIYYLVAVLWKLFGIHEWIFRLITLVIACAGLMSAHRLIHDITRQPFWSSWIVALLFTSPAVVYSTNFIPDMHAISFSLIACRFFYRYKTSGKNFWIYAAALFFALAGVIKPTALIPFCVLGGMFLLELLPFAAFKREKWFHTRWHVIVAFGAVIAFNLAWVMWVRNYNNEMGGWFTPHALFFPWNYPDAEMRNFLSMFREFLVNQLFSRTTLFLLISLLLLLFLNYKKLEHKMKWVLALTVLGCLSYVLMFFKWDVHDYYALVLIPLPLVILTFAVYLVAKHFATLLSNKSIQYFAAIFLIYNMWYCASNMQMRFNPKSEKLYLSSASEPEAERFKYLNWSYEQKFQSMTEVEPYLKSWGVDENDLVISIPDDSFNASLYLMHRRGWTSYEDDVFSQEGLMARQLRGARYLIINDSSFVKSRQFPEQFLINKIGEFKNLIVYELPPIQ